ncbi:hypothetical protein LSTR_LSTR010951 [Laodelphax striatellus]|uniref:Uncharacterized protein n=1 Tax=Laodelphax striatellus TaxID=195883 RepID=A0A482XZJ2_LAOST|nr:hypothetical protein LSTR_LSTR010951 [Laodelphax striatellus]
MTSHLSAVEKLFKSGEKKMWAQWSFGKSCAFGVIPVAFFLFGKHLDNAETERMTRFRDKSALYYRELGPNDKPSWP